MGQAGLGGLMVVGIALTVPWGGVNATLAEQSMGAVSQAAQPEADPDQNASPKTPPDPEAKTDPPQSSTCAEPAGADHWLDRSHSYLNARLCAPAVWFDGFFGDPRTLEETPVNTFFRVRNTVGWDERDGLGGGFQVNANIALPRLSERVRVLVSRDDTLAGDGLGVAELDEPDERTRLGVRFILSEALIGLTDVDATVRVESGGLNPRVSTRYLLRHQLSKTTLIRGTQTAFWERLDGFGTRSRLDVEVAPRFGRLLRWTTRGTLSQASQGVDWKSVLIGYQQLDARTALRADIGAFGRTRPEALTEEFFVSARIRRQWLRPWLFVELRPEYAWPKDSINDRRGSDWRLKLTFEIQFENNPATLSHRRQWDIQR